MRLTTRLLARGAVTAAATVVLGGAIAVPCAAQSQGVSLSEVLELRRRGVSTRQIVRSVGEYCRAFNLTDSTVRMLRASGGDESLVTGLRSACSVAPPEPLPGTILDVDFRRDSSSGIVAAPDRQCFATFEPEGLKFENLRPLGGCIVSFPTDSLASAVRLDLSIAGLGQRSSGSVIFGFGRATLEQRYYAVEIDAERRMALCLYTRASCARVLYRPHLEAIRAEADSVNRLQVVVRGREIEVRVNGPLAGSYTAPAPVSGHLLLGVGPSTTVILTRLLVRDLTAEHTTAASRE